MSRRTKGTAPWSWQNRDLWPDYLRGYLICSWLGHRYTVPKMYGMLCSRCRRYRGNEQQLYWNGRHFQ